MARRGKGSRGLRVLVVLATDVALAGAAATAAGAGSMRHGLSRYDRAVLADGPLAFWTLGDHPGSVTAVDASGNGRAAAYSSCVVLGEPRPMGQATSALLGAEQGCYATYRPSAVQDGSFTAEAWVQAGSTDKYYRTIVSTRGGPGPYAPDEFGFDLKLTGTTFPFGQELYADVGNGTYWLFNGGVAFTWAADTWYLVAVTVTPSTVTFYVDGRPIGVGTATPGETPLLFDAHRLVVLGGDPRYDASPFAPENFDGAIADVALYPSALGGDRLLAHYRAAVRCQQAGGRGRAGCRAR